MVTACAILATLMIGAGHRPPALYEPGRDPARGQLINCTGCCDPDRPIDPSRPTLVFVHGSNPLSPLLHFTMAQQLGTAVASRFGQQINVLGWDWNSHTVVSLSVTRNLRHAVVQGRLLAQAIELKGIDPARLHIVGQSSGCVVATSAARDLTRRLGRSPAQLTLLDPAPFYHGLVFQELAAGTASPRVEHYWVPGPSGYSRPVAHAGVQNLRLDLPPEYCNGLRGVIRPMHSDHLASVAWYIATAAHPETGQGFARSVLLR